MTTIAIIQPAYLPWLGYFDQLRRADVFVHYDDVQFTRKSWQTRNQVRGAAGAVWLTVPCKHVGRPLNINQVELVDPAFGTSWQDKQIAQLADYYRGAAHLEPYLSDLRDVINQPYHGICALNIAVVRLMAGWLGLKDKVMVRSSELDVPADLDTTARPLNICKKLGATTFLCGPTAKAYINAGAFDDAGIRLAWHDFAIAEYPQQHRPFVAYLSAIDAVFNIGEAAAGLLAPRAHDLREEKPRHP